jgi:nitrite reductase (cytochrome c-552)
MPDFESTEALQAYIGLNMEKLRAEKEVFLQEVVPEWLKEGKEREDNTPVEIISTSK